MDPVTQGLLGAGLAQTTAKKTKIKIAALCGALGGMAPDLDIFIRSETDPLLRIEFHRHFTHSLAFIPIGGLLVALAIWLILLRRKTNFSLVYIFTTLGFATHGLLDACTSYGTRLFWPFSELRVGWNLVSIIDPIYTGILLIFVVLCLWKKSAFIMRIGMILSLLYLGFGYSNKMQVQAYMHEIAQSRGHKIERILLNPTFGNNILWRSVYQYDGFYYIDAVRVLPFSEPEFKQGEKVMTIDKNKIFPSLPEGSTQRIDLERFAYFSQDYIYIHPSNPNIIADLRYGTLPHDTKSMWAIQISPEYPSQHVRWKNLRNIEQKNRDEFWQMLKDGF